MRNKKNNNLLHGRGFTLLELLVAITLMNLIALTLYSSMYIGMKAKKSSIGALQPYRAVIPIFTQFQEDLESAMEPSGLLAGSFVGNNSSGEKETDSIQFYCCNYLPDEEEKASNIIKVEYAVEKDDLQNDRFNLVRKKTTNLLSSKSSSSDDEILCRGVSSFEVRYYNGSGWADAWDSTTQDNQKPNAVQVSVTLEDTQPSQSHATDGHTNTFTRTVFLAQLDTSTARSTNAD